MSKGFSVRCLVLMDRARFVAQAFEAILCFRAGADARAALILLSRLCGRAGAEAVNLSRVPTLWVFLALVGRAGRVTLR